MGCCHEIQTAADLQPVPGLDQTHLCRILTRAVKGNESLHVATVVRVPAAWQNEISPHTPCLIYCPVCCTSVGIFAVRKSSFFKTPRLMIIMIDVACSRLKPTCTPAGSRSHEPDEGTCTLDILF